MAVKVCSNEIGDDGLKAMAAAPAIRTDFKKLILNRNCIEMPVEDWDECDDCKKHVGPGVKELAKVLKTHPGLEELELRRNTLEWGGRRWVTPRLGYCGAAQLWASALVIAAWLTVAVQLASNCKLAVQAQEL